MKSFSSMTKSKALPPAGADEKVSSLRLRSPSLMASAGALFTRRVDLSGGQSGNVRNGEGFLIVSKINKSCDFDSESGCDGRCFIVLIFFCIVLAGRCYFSSFRNFSTTSILSKVGTVLIFRFSN